MKIAIQQALKSLKDQLDEIKEKVEKEAMEVARRTVEKLGELDPNLAKELT